MSSKSKQTWEELFSFKDENEKIEHEADMISLRIAIELERLIEEMQMTKKKFAQKIGTSPAYVTQVLRGDKRVNMVFLAKVLQKLNVTFDFRFKSVDEAELYMFFDVLKFRKHKPKEIQNVEAMNSDFLKYAEKAS